MSLLPTTDKERKDIPIFDGCIGYFPDALLAVAHVSKVGNDQHNPGQPLHWARGKSTDQFNTALRHILDHKFGNGLLGGLRYDSDGTRHLAKAAWRILAALQLDIELERAEQERTRELDDAVADGLGEKPRKAAPPDSIVACRCGWQGAQPRLGLRIKRCPQCESLFEAITATGLLPPTPDGLGEPPPDWRGGA